MQTMQNTAKQNYPGLVTSYDTWPGNKVGLFYNAAEPRWGTWDISRALSCWVDEGAMDSQILQFFSGMSTTIKPSVSEQHVIDWPSVKSKLCSVSCSRWEHRPQNLWPQLVRNFIIRLVPVSKLGHDLPRPTQLTAFTWQQSQSYQR